MVDFFLTWLFGVVCGMALIIVLLTVKRDLLLALIKKQLEKDMKKNMKAANREDD